MNEKITDVQNLFWKAYKDFYNGRDIEKYNIDLGKILEKYRLVDPCIYNFCLSLKIAWAPIINGLKKWS